MSMIWSSRERNRSCSPLSRRSRGRIANPPLHHLEQKNHSLRFVRILKTEFARNSPSRGPNLANSITWPRPISPSVQWLENSSRTTDQLHAAVLGRLGIGRPQKLLLAQADGFEPRRCNAERIDQGVADGVGTLLAELEIVLAAASAVGVPDNQKPVALQIRMIERVRHQADGLERIRADAGRVEVELDRDGQLRQLVEIVGQGRAVHPGGARWVIQALDRHLPQPGGRQCRRRLLDSLKAGDETG